MKTVFLRVLEADDKATVLRNAIREAEDACESKRRFEVDVATFASVPRSPFAYWVSEPIRRIFQEHAPLKKLNRQICSGPDTGQDFRCIRLWWEVSQKEIGRECQWVMHAKGGAFNPYYSELSLVLMWGSNGHRLKAIPSANIRNSSEYYRPGLTWPLRTTSGISLRVLPAGSIFGHKGPGIFADHDDSDELLSLLAMTNSKPFAACVQLQLAAADAAARSYEVGIIQLTPIPRLSKADQRTLAALARRAWSLKRHLDTRTENSHAFTVPGLLQVQGSDLNVRVNAWVEHTQSVYAEVIALQAEIDTCCFDLYGIGKDVPQVNSDGIESVADHSGGADINADDEPEDAGNAQDNPDAAGLAAELISWTVGVAAGRYDVNLATGTRSLPAEPEPFEQLPTYSPAMLTADDGRPLTSPPAGYPIAFPENGLLVDDSGHARDITAAVRAVFDEVFKESADAWWSDLEALLDPKDRDLRMWLATSFFEYHLKHHSKSRRRAPIIWQLSVPSGRYSVWLYAHCVSRDSFIQIQNDLVSPKLVHEERHLASLMQSAGDNPSSKESKEIETHEAFVGELRDLLDKVKQVAPIWHPTLDDGVVLTMSPLWRLVPQHKPWQKEIKSKWDELVAGRYDWAHLAMHLWPERVIPKCATDRSLAIAHDLEENFWFEDEDGKWTPYKKPKKPIADLVSERTSAAVKAALKSLLDSPDPASGIKRSRKSKAA